MATTSLLIGSRDNWADQTMTAPALTVSASTGDALYLDHATAALSIFAQMEADADVTSVELLQNGKVLITLASAGPLTWGSATTLRDLLGFTGDKGSAATHTSDTISPLVWFPMRQEEPRRSILGVSGASAHLLDVAQMRDGTQVVTRFGVNRTNTFLWRWVPQDRFWTTNEAPGEWYDFHDEILVRGRRFQLYRGVDMDPASSSAASYSSPLGTFQARVSEMGGRVMTMRSAGFETVDSKFDIELPVVEVAEYG